MSKDTSKSKRKKSKTSKEAKKADTGKKAKKTKDKKAKKTKKAKETKGRQGGISRDAVITVRAKTNPRRPGTKTHERFALYKTGMTVAAFIKKGGRMRDVRKDKANGHIKVKKASD